MGHVPDSQVKQSRLLPALLGQSRHLEPQILQAPVESVKEEYIRFDMCLRTPRPSASSFYSSV